MECKVCGHNELVASVALVVEAPMAARSGSVKLGGLKFSNVDIKLRWEAQKPLRGPIHCAACASEHYYDTRLPDGLVLGKMKDAEGP